MSENREATISLLLASQCALTARVNANAEAIALTSDVDALAATVRTLMTNVATLTVDENLRIAAYTRRDKQGVKDELDRVFAYFPRLKERIQQQAGTLSGGEQQMLAIARALMLKPRLMLLDEPSFGLAPLIVQEIFRILRRINEEEKVSMLLVEQNAALALDLADTAYVLETGRVVMSGPAAVVKNDENVRKSYLGY